jgi:hypothetical protein
MRKTRFCRIAYTVDDIDRNVAALKDLFDMESQFVGFVPPSIRVAIGEHGVEPIQLIERWPVFETLPLPLIEVALAVDDAEKCKAILSKAGYEPLVVSHLPKPNADEYLYGDIDGLPIMVCTDGDNEAQLAPFIDLENAAPPKIGCVTVVVDSVDRVAADFGRFFDMEFVETDPKGLGTRALVGAHRLRIVEKPDPAVRPHLLGPLLSMDIIVENPESVRARLEQAGIPRVARWALRSGRTGDFFGNGLDRVPIAVYDVRDEAELLGSR